MEAEARRQLASEGFEADHVRLERSVELRYGRQVHELRTPFASEAASGPSLAKLASDFEALYERRFGKGSAYREAGIEMTRFRLTARGLLDRDVPVMAPIEGDDPAAAAMGTRRAYSTADEAMIDMPLYDFELLRPGNVVSGPAVVHTPITTLVLQAGQTGTIDPLRNVVVDLA